MPMNEQPPWGQKKRPPSEDFLANLIQKIQDFFNQQNGDSGEGSNSPSQGRTPSPLQGGGIFFTLIAAAFLVQIAFTAFFTIAAGEEGVILRLGKYNRTTEPGLHFKIPYVEELVKVNVEQVRKEEFGFRSRNSTANGSGNYNRSGFDIESLMLTGDKNVIEVAWIVQYKVSNPVQFLFKVQNVSQAVRDASEMVVRRIVGNMDFDYVLGNRDILAAEAKKELQGELNNLEAGVEILNLQLQDINPPEPVKPAFNEVNEADQDMKRLVNEAEKTYNEIIPKARGSAKQIVEEAHGYAVERVNRAQGEVSRFQAILKEYRGAETVTRQRLYLEAMEEILPKTAHLYIMNDSQHPALPLIDLSGAQQKTDKEAGVNGAQPENKK